MANIKQKFIKPGSDLNYSEGVKVLAEVAIKKNQIVYVSGSTGKRLKVNLADADNATDATRPNGRLMIAKTDISANTTGIVLPWRLVTDFNTSTSSGIGAPVYLRDSVGATEADNMTFSAPSGDAQVIVLGRVTVDATAANGGAMMICPSAPESRNQGGAITGVAGATGVGTGRPLEQLVIETAASATAQDFSLDYPIIVTGMAVVPKAGSATVNVDLYKGATTTSIAIQVATGNVINIKSFTTGIIPANCIVAAGTVLRVKKSGAGTAGDLVIIDYIRG